MCVEGKNERARDYGLEELAAVLDPVDEEDVLEGGFFSLFDSLFVCAFASLLVSLSDAFLDAPLAS